MLVATDEYYRPAALSDIERALAATTSVSLDDPSIEWSTVLHTCSASVKGKSMLASSRERQQRG